MQKIKQIIDEIKTLKLEATHKSALRIFQLLDNNSKLFKEVLEKNEYDYLLGAFEEIAYRNPGTFSTRDKDDYLKLIENLLFHCNRLV